MRSFSSFIAAVSGACLCLAASDPSYLSCGSSTLTVDLEYGIYKGVHNQSTGLSIWKGIPFAAPPVGALRWQPPQPPPKNSTNVITASNFGPACPQSPPAFPGVPFIPGGSEDCLYVNVYAPSCDNDKKFVEAESTGKSGKGLPVVVWIHGGGYGAGEGRSNDFSGLINDNGNGFVGVSIQYRLGAFGFASSKEIKRRGALNIGLLDQVFALEWVQKHIGKFGGDPDQVTISGVSAGAGSVMLLAMAKGGRLGTKLFKNGIAASPYLPSQPAYDDPSLEMHYHDFAAAAGCASAKDVFDCLVKADTLVLQYASSNVSASPPTRYGNWAFIPVTDGTLIEQIPSVQLGDKKVNGERILVGNNADEGAAFVPPDIKTEADLIAYLHMVFPNLSEANVLQILDAYPSSSGPVNPDDPKYPTNGHGPGTAVNISQLATGQLQRAFNIYAEAVFVCPSYWLASSFTGHGRKAYHYQYSVPVAGHGTDIAGYFGPPTPNQGPEFVAAFRKIWGNFIIKSNPSISDAVANGPSAPNPGRSNPASNWPTWTDSNPILINLNETGGTPYTSTVGSLTPINITQYMDPGLVNDITSENAYTWEGGRGKRCDFWNILGPLVPQ